MRKNRAKNNSKQNIHSQRLKSIRPFVDFDYDLRRPLTKYAKSKIKKYFDIVDNLTSHPTYLYRPRNKDRLRIAQEYGGGHDKHIKVAFIPTADEKPKLLFNKSGMVVREKYITTRFGEFDIDALIQDHKKEVRRVTKKFRKAKRFKIAAGPHMIENTYSASIIPDEVDDLMQKYKNEEANNYFGNWMRGLYAFEFQNQLDKDSAERIRDREKAKIKKAREKARRKTQNKRK